MLSHQAIWNAIDALAARRGLTVSGLARCAGLDATAFNPSKRMSADGRARWPSTESIAKVLQATGETAATFFQDGAALAPPCRRIPHIELVRAGDGRFFDEAGLPRGPGWEEIAFPDPGLEPAFALKIAGDGAAPVYRDGDTIIVAPQAGLRRGDRVVAKARGDELMVKTLGRRTARTVELISLNGDGSARVIDAGDLEWLSRIVWASQ